MKIKFEKNNILQSIGIEFKNEIDYYYYMCKLIEELYYNNKNYTNKQYFKIEELKEILDNMECEK